MKKFFYDNFDLIVKFILLVLMLIVGLNLYKGNYTITKEFIQEQEQIQKDKK